jgi:hypothetical protein
MHPVFVKNRKLPSKALELSDYERIFTCVKIIIRKKNKTEDKED